MTLQLKENKSRCLPIPRASGDKNESAEGWCELAKTELSPPREVGRLSKIMYRRDLQESRPEDRGGFCTFLDADHADGGLRKITRGSPPFPGRKQKSTRSRACH